MPINESGRSTNRAADTGYFCCPWGLRQVSSISFQFTFQLGNRSIRIIGQDIISSDQIHRRCGTWSRYSDRGGRWRRGGSRAGPAISKGTHRSDMAAPHFPTYDDDEQERSKMPSPAQLHGWTSRIRTSAVAGSDRVEEDSRRAALRISSSRSGCDTLFCDR